MTLTIQNWTTFRKHIALVALALDSLFVKYSNTMIVSLSYLFSKS